MLSTLLAEPSTPLVRFVQRTGVRLVARSSLCAAVEFPAAATELTRTCYILVSRPIKGGINGLPGLISRDQHVAMIVL